MIIAQGFIFNAVTPDESILTILSLDRMGTHFSKQTGHHNGVLSGHEIMAYAFLSGTQCHPKRKQITRSVIFYILFNYFLARDGLSSNWSR